MDDLFVIWLSNKLVRRLVDPQVLQQSRERAAGASFAVGFSGKAFYTKDLQEPNATAADSSAPAEAPDEPAHSGSQQSGRSAE
jgi:hypothetical protein